MKILPTLAGHLKIQPEKHSEWTLLRQIIRDANPTQMATDFSARMDSDSCWEDIVQPELEETFNHQLTCVASATKITDDEGFIIPRDRLMDWYGALNQARLMLEKAHTLSTLDLNEINTFPPPLRQAMIRENAYRRLQGLILDFLSQ